MIIFLCLVFMIDVWLPRPYGSLFCMALAALACARLVIVSRRLRREYEKAFGRPVPIGRTDEDIAKILDWHRIERK